MSQILHGKKSGNLSVTAVIYYAVKRHGMSSLIHLSEGTGILCTVIKMTAFIILPFCLTYFHQIHIHIILGIKMNSGLQFPIFVYNFIRLWVEFLFLWASVNKMNMMTIVCLMRLCLNGVINFDKEKNALTIWFV